MRRSTGAFSALGLAFPMRRPGSAPFKSEILDDMDLHDRGLSLGREGLHSRGSHAVFSSTRSALAQTSALGSRDTSPAWIYLSPTQRQPRARTTAPTSGSSVRTASAEAAPRLSSLSAASADHSFMASCLQQRDASTVVRRLLPARLPYQALKR